MNSPSVRGVVAQAFARYPSRVRVRLLDIREMIFAIAAETDGVGPLTETLRWGEPAYLTEKSRSGTTIRLGISKLAPEDGAVFFNCRTTLVEGFRTHFADNFDYEGNRALIVPATVRLPSERLALCLRAALTYHRRKSTGFDL